MSVFGHALGRKVWLDRGHFVNYPGQIMVVLVGPSGSKKSTATQIAKSLLEKLPDVNIVANKLSAQSLIDSLDRGFVANGAGKLVRAESIGFIYAPELSSFIPRQQYVEELIPLITDFSDVWDSDTPWRYKTRGKGEIELKRPMLGFLGASTPDWIASNIPEEAHGGGFMSRFFWVFQNSSDRVFPFPETNPGMVRVKNELLAELLWIAENVKGGFVWTKDAREWWEKFYLNWKKLPQTRMSGLIGGYFSRRPEHTLRVAMCLEIANTRKTEITVPALESANVALALLEQQLPNAFAYKKLSPAGQNVQYISDILATHGKLSRRDLLRKSHLTLAELSSALETLKNAGICEEFLAPGGGFVYHYVPPLGP